MDKAMSEVGSEYEIQLDNRSVQQKLKDLYPGMPADEVECIFMDHIIKCFMVIFTNDSSQHLLLNDDLIEITLTCLENSESITKES